MHTRNRIRSVVAMAAAMLLVLSGTALAAVTFHGPAVSTNGTTASTLTLNAPALDAGDVLLAQITASKDFTSSDTICPPEGWTSIERVTYEGKIIQEIFTYRANTAQSAMGHTWNVRNSTCSGSPSSNKGMSGGLMRYTGVDITATVDGSRIATGSSSSATAPSVTTTRDGAMIVRFFSAFKNLNFMTTANRLYSVGHDNISSERTAAAYQTGQAAAGSTGTFIAGMDSSAEWVATTVALQGVEEVIPVTHALSVTKAGDGSGTVTSSPAGIDCGSDCTEDYEEGTSVTLTATADSGSEFAGWSGGSGTVNPNGTYTVSMTAARNVTATFNLEPVIPVTHELSVGKAGTGTGTVTSSPAGIDCGSDCSEDYEEGTSVTLTATADSGSEFAGWSGGSGTVNPNGTYTVTMTAARNVTATFNLEQGGNDNPTCDLTGTFLAPIKDGARNIVKLGNVIPVKLSVVDCDGKPVTNATLSIRVTNGSDAEDTAAGTEQVAESVSSADSSGVMRLSDGKYIYNLATKSLKGGFDYTIVVKDTTTSAWNDAPTVATAVIQPKK